MTNLIFYPCYGASTQFHMNWGWQGGIEGGNGFYFDVIPRNEPTLNFQHGRKILSNIHL